MGVCTDGIRGCVFQLLNVVFFVCGTALLGVAIWMAVEQPPFVGGDVNAQIWETAIYTALCLGIVIIAVGILGCYSAGRNTSFCLTLYIVAVIVTMCGQLTVAILAIVFRNEIGGSFLDSMHEDITYKYGHDNHLGLTAQWDDQMSALVCCGASGPQDFSTSYYFNDTGLSVPIRCCHSTIDSEITTCRDEATNEVEDPDFLITKGCHDVTSDIIRVQSAILIGLGFGFPMIQVFSIVFARCLIRYRQEPPKRKK